MSIVDFVFSSLITILLILSAPWRIVVWSRLPNALPRDCTVLVVIWRQRYIAICLGYTISAERFCERISSDLILKCSATISIISSGVISLLESGEIKSFNASSANSTVIGLDESFAKAESFVKAPSSSLILDLIWVAT